MTWTSEFKRLTRNKMQIRNVSNLNQIQAGVILLTKGTSSVVVKEGNILLNDCSIEVLSEAACNSLTQQVECSCSDSSGDSGELNRNNLKLVKIVSRQTLNGFNLNLQ